jgi:hypothetical protein
MKSSPFSAVGRLPSSIQVAYNLHAWTIRSHSNCHGWSEVPSVRVYSTRISEKETDYDTTREEPHRPIVKRRKSATVFVAASEIASLINVNPHVTVADAVERLWEKTNRKLFRDALARNRLQFYTQEQRLEELGALRLAKATVEADDPKEYQTRLASTLEKAATVQDRSIVKDFINTSKGIKSEKETFDVLKEKRPKGQLKADANLYQKVINIPRSRLSYLVSGYIDGVETNNQRIIEIKARQSRLFHHVPLYEQVQCQAYLFLTGFSTCEHVESFRGTQLSTTLKHDPAFWNHVVERLNRVIVAFDRLMKEEKTQDDFLRTRELAAGAATRSNGRNSRNSRRSSSKSLVFEKTLKEEQ